jgi:uncharacterized SAM-binding protein YcdF (DUF218 family)
VKIEASKPRPTSRWQLFRRRQVPLPTWRGWLLLLALIALLAFGLFRGAYPFLAVNAPVPGGILIVEGWGSDEVMRRTAERFKESLPENHTGFKKVLVTGGVVDVGGPLMIYKTYADLGTAILLKTGLNTNEVEAVPAPFVQRDRTYAAAVSLKQWLDSHQIEAKAINLITVGPHARRSRLLFQKALGKQYKVGVISLALTDYDQKHWWRSSSGVRVVTSELLAYGYARFWFKPSRM